MRRLPILKLDSREIYEPVAVETINVAQVVANPVQREKAVADPANLPEEGGRLDFPPYPEKWAPLVQEHYGGVGYWRRVEAGGLVWIQHWLWYLHNPKAYAGYGAHEGDWEMLQIGYAEDTPVCVTASQHSSGGARMWWDVELENDRPVIYVALGSHANYFEPKGGSGADDVADGQGKVLDLKWREMGPWASWKGRWGNSTGIGKSPVSPGRHLAWGAPHRFHSQAR